MKSLLNGVNKNYAPVYQINMTEFQSGFEGTIQRFSTTELNIFNIYSTLILTLEVLEYEMR